MTFSLVHFSIKLNFHIRLSVQLRAKRQRLQAIIQDTAWAVWPCGVRELRAAPWSLRATRRVCGGFSAACFENSSLCFTAAFERISPSISNRSNTRNSAAAAVDRWNSRSLTSCTSMTPGNEALSGATIRCRTHENTTSHDPSLLPPGSILLSNDPKQLRAVWQKATHSSSNQVTRRPSLTTSFIKCPQDAS